MSIIELIAFRASPTIQKQVIPFQLNNHGTSRKSSTANTLNAHSESKHSCPIWHSNAKPNSVVRVVESLKRQHLLQLEKAQRNSIDAHE